MSQWESERLGVLAEFRNGLNYTDADQGEGLAVVGVSDFKDNVIVDFCGLAQVSMSALGKADALIRKGDIVFVRSNGNRELIGRSMFVRDEPPMATSHSGFTIRCRFHAPRCHPRFYAYLLRGPIVRQTLSAHGGGTNISNLNQGILASLLVPIPDYRTQERIASILSNYDDLIENNTRRMAILEETAQRVYEEWFVNSTAPASLGAPLVDSPVGLIPQGWDVVRLGEVVSHSIGGGWGSDVAEPGSTPAGVIRGTDIPKVRVGQIDTVPIRFISESQIRNRILRPGDIVMEVSGGSKDQPVGRVLLVGRTSATIHEQSICASFCRLIRPKVEMVGSNFLFQHLDRAYRTREIMIYQKQSTGLSNLRFTDMLERHLIAVPPREIVAKFEAAIGNLWSLLEVLGGQNRNLRAQRELLLPKLVAGEIDVSEAEELMEAAE